jgi:acyl-coenzyme A synthetase/AMP-(fatty) acid ligase
MPKSSRMSKALQLKNARREAKFEAKTDLHYRYTGCPLPGVDADVPDRKREFPRVESVLAQRSPKRLSRTTWVSLDRSSRASFSYAIGVKEVFRLRQDLSVQY